MDFIPKPKLYQYFQNNYPTTESTNNWHLFDCPLCDGQRTGSVHFKMGLVKCFKGCFTGSIIEFVQEMESCSEDEAKTILWETEASNILLEDVIETKGTVRLTKVDITLPDGYHSILEGEGTLAKRARAYLTRRGFNLKKLDRKGFGYCDQRNTDILKNFYGYIIVPFKEDGKLVYYLGRNFMGDEVYRYKNPPSDFVGVGKSEVIYNEEALYLYKTVFVLEGWSDAETIGKHATATLGWAMSDVQKARYFKSSAERLVFVPDRDKEGDDKEFYKKAVQLALEFLDSGKQVYVLDPYDESLEGLGKDANNIGRQPIIDLYKRTEPLTWGSALNILAT